MEYLVVLAFLMLLSTGYIVVVNNISNNIKRK